MRLPRLSFPVILLCFRGVLADFLGPPYPVPRDLSSNHSLVAASWGNLTSSLEAAVSDNQSTTSPSALAGLKDVTFSVGGFSLHDPAAERLQYHHTAAEVANASTGTNKVDGDSIYRVASMTKLLTVFAGLRQLKSQDWNRPLTECIPGLAEVARSNTGQDDPIYTTKWEDITVGALAAMTGGVPRDAIPWAEGELLAQAVTAEGYGTTPIDLANLGLPPLNMTDAAASSPCLDPEVTNCTQTLYVQGVKPRPPSFLPWTEPGYANNGIILLGIALSNITSKSLDQIYRQSIFDPLRMKSSSSTVPMSQLARAVVTSNNVTASNFLLDGGISKASGGCFSSTNDLAKFGVGILNSTLLPPKQTRKWMKPVSHTANLNYSVGAPWEIYRYTFSSGVTTDIYTKLGDSGWWGGYIVLLPDFDAGFSILATSTSSERSVLTRVLADLINESILSALMAQSAAEAEHNYAGTYISTVQGLNSSLTLSVNRSAPGVMVSSFISNGTDVTPKLDTLLGSRRLLPIIASLENGQVAFRASQMGGAKGTEALGLFTGQFTQNLDWLTVDATTYGGTGVGLFVFDLDEEGFATAATPAAWRVRLERRRAG